MLGPNLILLFASDVDASAEFYERIFDWTPTPYKPNGGVHYFTDTVSIVILPEGAFRSGTTGIPRGYGTSICFQVDDIELMHKHVEAMGAEIVLPPEESGYGVTFSFADPDGARVTVYAESKDEDEDLEGDEE